MPVSCGEKGLWLAVRWGVVFHAAAKVAVGGRDANIVN